MFLNPDSSRLPTFDPFQQVFLVLVVVGN